MLQVSLLQLLLPGVKRLCLGATAGERVLSFVLAKFVRRVRVIVGIRLLIKQRSINVLLGVLVSLGEAEFLLEDRRALITNLWWQVRAG